MLAPSWRGSLPQEGDTLGMLPPTNGVVEVGLWTYVVGIAPVLALGAKLNGTYIQPGDVIKVDKRAFSDGMHPTAGGSGRRRPWESSAVGVSEVCRGWSRGGLASCLTFGDVKVLVGESGLRGICRLGIHRALFNPLVWGMSLFCLARQHAKQQSFTCSELMIRTSLSHESAKKTKDQQRHSSTQVAK